MRESLVPYAAEGSYDPVRNAIRNPQSLNVFRPGRCYWAIQEAGLTSLPASARRLVGRLSADGSRITSWGRELCGPWLSLREFAGRCFGINPGLRRRLAGRRSGDAYGELGRDIAVLQRIGGQPESRYAQPLMQALMCFDSQWVRRSGRNERVFRFVVGRSIPRKGRMADAAAIAAA